MGEISYGPLAGSHSNFMQWFSRHFLKSGYFLGIIPKKQDG